MGHWDPEALVIRWFCMLGLALGCGLGSAAEPVKLQVLCTTDTLGTYLPQDPYTRLPRVGGWAQLATLIRSRLAAQPATLLVDCGNTLQGEPLSAIRARTQPSHLDPAISVMNVLGFHGMALGRQDFAFGLASLRSTEEQARFPFLAANLVQRGTGKSAFTPYALHEIQGVRVAILGLTGITPADPELVLQDPLETARTYLPVLRDREKADLVVVSLHASAIQARRLAETLKGMDLLLLGHTQESAATTLAGVPVLQAGSHGRALGRAELTLVQERGRWKLTSVHTELLAPDAFTAPDPVTLELTRAQREHADRYLDTFATQLQTDLDGRWARMEDTPLAQLLHAVSRSATGADLTAVNVPNPRYFVPAGPTSVRQFWALAPCEDPVAVIRIQGTQLRAYLEHSSRTFLASHGTDLFQKQIPLTDIDMVAGCSYALNLSAPVGRRVQALKFNGKAVEPTQTFTLALPARRLQGDGGYLQAMNWTGQPERLTSQSFRNLLLEYVLARPTLTLPVVHHWRTIPYLDRERVALQQ